MNRRLAGYPLAEGMGFDLSSLLGSSSTASAAIGAVSSVVATNPTFLLNRERLAAVAQMGYNGAALYATWQPALFLFSVSGAIASGYMLWKRRSKGGESVALWTAATLSSLGVAYFTRPAFMRPDPVNPPAGTPTAMDGIFAYLDQKAANYSYYTPGWEGQVLTQLAADAGGGTVDPALATLLTEGSH